MKLKFEKGAGEENIRFQILNAWKRTSKKQKVFLLRVVEWRGASVACTKYLLVRE